MAEGQPEGALLGGELHQPAELAGGPHPLALLGKGAGEEAAERRVIRALPGRRLEIPLGLVPAAQGGEELSSQEAGRHALRVGGEGLSA